MKSDACCVCKFSLLDDYCHFSWSGAPFSKTSSAVKLCSYCGYLVIPQVVNGFAIMGTSSGDIFTAQEMRDEGFNDKARLKQSIKSVGQVLGLTNKQIAAKLKG